MKGYEKLIFLHLPAFAVSILFFPQKMDKTTTFPDIFNTKNINLHFTLYIITTKHQVNNLTIYITFYPYCYKHWKWPENTEKTGV